MGKDFGSMARAALNKRNVKKKRKITISRLSHSNSQQREGNPRARTLRSDGRSWTGPCIVKCVLVSLLRWSVYGSMHTCPKIDAVLTVTSDSEPPSAQAGRRAASLK